MKRALAIAPIAALLACRDRPAPPAPPSIASSVAPPPIASSVAPPASSSTAPPARPLDPLQRVLAAAPITSIVPVHRPLARPGSFEAMLAAPEGRRGVFLEIATAASPVGYRRALAFHRLARALGARVVPEAALRHVGLAELAAAAEGSAGAAASLRDARVLNDGTVDVLVTARGTARAGSPWEAPDARPVDLDHSREGATWEVWARSPEPAQGEDRGLLRDYVEALVLDYLAAAVARRTVLVTAGEPRAIVLDDNASAFPPRPEAPVLDRMLRRLRGIERFPRGMREALAALDRDRAAALFAEGGFETWILSPRVRVELEERRATLLTLVEARVAVRGAEAVLCL